MTRSHSIFSTPFAHGSAVHAGSCLKIRILPKKTSIFIQKFYSNWIRFFWFFFPRGSSPLQWLSARSPDGYYQKQVFASRKKRENSTWYFLCVLIILNCFVAGATPQPPFLITEWMKREVLALNREGNIGKIFPTTFWKSFTSSSSTKLFSPMFFLCNILF